MKISPRSRRWLRWIFLLLVLPVALVAIFYLVENYRGRRAWDRYCAEAKSRGVKLYLRDFLQPDIPDEENYAAIPVIREMFAAKRDSKIASNTFELSSKFRTKPPSRPDMYLGRRTDLTAWQTFFRTEQYLDATTENPARDVLRALQKYEPALQQLRDASRRPKCKFPTRWEDGFQVEFPHLSNLHRALILFALRINSHLTLGENDDALMEMQHSLRVHEALTTEPMILSALIRVTTLTRLTEEVWDGMAGGLWRDQDLRAIDFSFGKLDLIRDMHFAMESERGWFNQALEPIIVGSGKEDLRDFLEAISPGSVAEKLFAFAPSGWAFENFAMLNRCRDDCTLRYDPVREFFPERLDEDAWLEQQFQSQLWKQVTPLKRFKYSLVFATVGVFFLLHAEMIQLQAHTRVQHVRLACALELFRRANGRFPDTLDALVPGFIAAVPKDILDGQPMRYRLNADGGYDLWSIGKNRIDDGGVVPKNKSAPEPDWLWHMPPPAR